MQSRILGSASRTRDLFRPACVRHAAVSSPMIFAASTTLFLPMFEMSLMALAAGNCLISTFDRVETPSCPLRLPRIDSIKIPKAGSPRQIFSIEMDGNSLFHQSAQHPFLKFANFTIQNHMRQMGSFPPESFAVQTVQPHVAFRGSRSRLRPGDTAANHCYLPVGKKLFKRISERCNRMILLVTFLRRLLINFFHSLLPLLREARPRSARGYIPIPR